MSTLKLAPALMGEVDIIKQIQNLPGVTTVGEAATGFNVRGGSVDQNLILYDGLPVGNSSHVFGFFSSFNRKRFALLLCIAGAFQRNMVAVHHPFLILNQEKEAMRNGMAMWGLDLSLVIL